MIFPPYTVQSSQRISAADKFFAWRKWMMALTSQSAGFSMTSAIMNESFTGTSKQMILPKILLEPHQTGLFNCAKIECYPHFSAQYKDQKLIF